MTKLVKFDIVILESFLMKSVPFGRSFPLIKKDILTASLPLLLWILQDFTGTVLEKVESIFSFIKIKKSYNFYNQHKIIKERKTIMIEKQIEDFSIEQIAKSGQCFRIHKEKDGSFSNVAFGKHLRIIQKNEQVLFDCSETEFKEIWESYFDLKTDYHKIKASVDKNDSYLTKAVNYGWGMRILNQDLWEIIITFLISQNNNIPRIRKSVAALCEKFGEKKITPEDKIYYTFPESETLASAKMEGLAGLGLGYRDKYIYKMACSVADGSFSLETLKKQDTATAHKMLTDQYGIGNKVAACIALFALHHVDAFPIDTHVKKILAEHYPDGFPYEKYKGYAGILQQYMFFYDL